MVFFSKATSSVEPEFQYWWNCSSAASCSWTSELSYLSVPSGAGSTGVYQINFYVWRHGESIGEAGYATWEVEVREDEMPIVVLGVGWVEGQRLSTSKVSVEVEAQVEETNCKASNDLLWQWALVGEDGMTIISELSTVLSQDG